MDELENKVQEFIEGSDQGETTSQSEQVSEEQPTSETETTAENYIEIEGQKYTIEELKDLMQKAKNYEHLLPEFTRRSQRLAELEKKLETSENPEDRVRAEAIKYLRENLGLVTKEDLDNFMNQLVTGLQTYITETQKLNEAVAYLEKKYDGTVYPRFDFEAVRRYIRQKYGDKIPEIVDLEDEYLAMNKEFFEKLPQKLSEVKKTSVPTERGIGATPTGVSKKIVEKPTKPDEISLEEAALDFWKQL